MNESPLFCERCGAELEPGKAEFYVVRIEAFADPTPPSITAEDLQRDIAAEIERLPASMRDLSEQEAMDQVYWKMVLYLCTARYQRWIDTRCADRLQVNREAPLQLADARPDRPPDSTKTNLDGLRIDRSNSSLLTTTPVCPAEGG